MIAFYDRFDAGVIPRRDDPLEVARSRGLPGPLRTALNPRFARFPHAATGFDARQARVLARLSDNWRPAVMPGPSPPRELFG